MPLLVFEINYCCIDIGNLFGLYKIIKIPGQYNYYKYYQVINWITNDFQNIIVEFVH